MGCTVFWDAQEFSDVCQARTRDELVSLAETAGWQYEIAPEEFVARVVNLESSPGEARPVERRFRLMGVTLFPFGRDEADSRPRLSFVFDNTNTTNPLLRNRLITLAPAWYWLEWSPRLRDQYPILAQQREEPIYGVRPDGSMRVRRTELPGFIKFLNTVRATSLPLLDIRTSDRLARKMINDPHTNPFGGRGAKRAEQESLADVAEGLGVLFASHRYDEWRLGLHAEDEIEREQARANRAASMSQDRAGGRQGHAAGRQGTRGAQGSPGRQDRFPMRRGRDSSGTSRY